MFIRFRCQSPLTEVFHNGPMVLRKLTYSIDGVPRTLTFSLKMPFGLYLKDQSRPLYVYFCSLLNTMTNIAQIWTINGIFEVVLGIRTRDRMMVGVDESTELWWPFGLVVFPLLAK